MKDIVVSVAANVYNLMLFGIPMACALWLIWRAERTRRSYDQLVQAGALTAESARAAHKASEKRALWKALAAFVAVGLLVILLDAWAQDIVRAAHRMRY